MTEQPDEYVLITVGVPSGNVWISRNKPPREPVRLFEHLPCGGLVVTPATHKTVCPALREDPA